MTDKRQKATKIKCKLEESQNSQYLCHMVFSRRSIWLLLKLVGRWTQHFTKIDQKTRKIGQIYIKTPWLLDLLCEHWFASSVWNFCSWVADVPPRETFPAAKSEEKRMFSQATFLCTYQCIAPTGGVRTDRWGIWPVNFVQGKGCFE